MQHTPPAAAQYSSMRDERRSKGKTSHTIHQQNKQKRTERIKGKTSHTRTTEKKQKQDTKRRETPLCIAFVRSFLWLSFLALRFSRLAAPFAAILPLHLFTLDRVLVLPFPFSTYRLWDGCVVCELSKKESVRSISPAVGDLPTQGFVLPQPPSATHVHPTHPPNPTATDPHSRKQTTTTQSPRSDRLSAALDVRRVGARCWLQSSSPIPTPAPLHAEGKRTQPPVRPTHPSTSNLQ